MWASLTHATPLGEGGEEGIRKTCVVVGHDRRGDIRSLGASLRISVWATRAAYCATMTQFAICGPVSSRRDASSSRSPLRTLYKDFLSQQFGFACENRFLAPGSPHPL
jgi:hypothetical protein